MNLGSFYRLAGIVGVLMLALAAWGLARVGPDATVPIHWDAAGNPNGYGPAWAGFLLVPAITLGLVALFAAIPRIEPRRANLERSGSAYRTTVVAVLVLMLGVHAVVVLAGVGIAVPVAPIIGGGVGLLFAVLGNVMATVRSNFLVGVRTPWTLSSELAWDRTHRLVGRMFVVGGIGMFLASLLGNTLVLAALIVAFMGAVLVVSLVYSYRVWRDDPDRHPIGGAS